MNKPSVQKRRGKRRYDSEFKASTLRLVASGRSVASVAESLGIDKSLIYTWRRQANPLSEEEEAELNELAQLRQEVLILREERDILKKALAIFSRKTDG
ncbi:MAG: transposase [Bacteroidota bacterium]